MHLPLIFLCVTTAAAISAQCGTTVYSQQDIDDAIDKAAMANSNPQTFGGRYPHRFANRENIPFAGCDSGAPFVEYPLKRDQAWETGPPGPDRVVYDRDTQTYCGAMTRTGAASGRGYVACQDMD